MSDETKAQVGVTSKPEFTKVGFIKSYLLPALFTFLIPGFGLWFFNHVEAHYDRQFRAAIISQLKTDNSITEEKRQQGIAFFTATPISKVLASSTPQARRVQAGFSGVK